MAVRVGWLEKVLKPDTDPIAASFGWLEKFLCPRRTGRSGGVWISLLHTAGTANP